MIIAQVLLFSLFVPFFLWPVEKLFPNPQIIEEIAKAIIILPLVDLKTAAKKKFLLAILAGFGFAFTESVFYLYNIFLVGNFKTYLLRLLLTVPLHSLTYLIILAPALINKKLIFLGLFIAIVLHYFFNRFVVLI